MSATLGKISWESRWSWNFRMDGSAVLNKVREHTSHWLVDFYQYVQKNPTIIENGKCGILEALENGVPSDDPFEQV